MMSLISLTSRPGFDLGNVLTDSGDSTASTSDLFAPDSTKIDAGLKPCGLIAATDRFAVFGETFSPTGDARAGEVNTERGAAIGKFDSTTNAPEFEYTAALSEREAVIELADGTGGFVALTGGVLAGGIGAPGLGLGRFILTAI